MELGLGPVPDDGHGIRPFRSEILGGHRRHGCRTQRRQDRHLAQQHRISVADIGQDTEGRDRLPAVTGVLGMAVDVLEAVELPVTRRHQLDHAIRAVGGDAWGLVEELPAAEVLLDIGRKIGEEALHADRVHELHHMIDADEGNDVELAVHGR